MTSLTFQTTRSVLSEPGASRKVGSLLKEMGCKSAFLVTDAGLVKMGLHQALLEGLKEAGISVCLFEDVVPDPPESVIHKATEQARAADADAVIGFGGGSSMDTAKLAACLAKSSQPLEEMYGIGFVKDERLPLILLPTTAGTGSEVTPISIITTGASEKKGVVSRQLLPDWAVLDADLTAGLPCPIAAANGVDAMVHAIEAYTSKHKKNRISDCLAREALALLSENIREVCAPNASAEARSNMLIGAMMAGMAFTNAPVAAVHALAYPLGGHFHVTHGLSNALVLTPVMRFNLPEAKAHYDELSPIILSGLGKGGSGAEDLITALEELSDEIGLERKLSQVGVSHSNLPLLAEDAMKQTRLLVNNPREVTYDDAYAIYEAVL